MFHVLVGCGVWGGCVSDVGFIFKWGGHPMGASVLIFDGVVLKKIVGWAGGVF